MVGREGGIDMPWRPMDSALRFPKNERDQVPRIIIKCDRGEVEAYWQHCKDPGVSGWWVDPAIIPSVVKKSRGLEAARGMRRKCGMLLKRYLDRRYFPRRYSDRHSMDRRFYARRKLQLDWPTGGERRVKERRHGLDRRRNERRSGYDRRKQEMDNLS
jgi:hypothetical protein